jgi:pimeloyl-ACP methyl ester carboxylesterase
LAELFAFERGESGDPVVFLHGFGQSHTTWAGVIDRMDAERHVIAYDLPGHSRSLGVLHGSAAVAAKAVLTDLERRGIARAHYVGHSMGGAVAALIALRTPGRVASLTLLAPGGFGPEINKAALCRHAAARDEAEIAASLEPFFAGRAPEGVATALAKERRAPGANAALAEILATFFEGDTQKALPLADIARLSMPKQVVWGEEDRVLPVEQARALPAGLPVRLFEGVGHMLPQEIPAEIARLVEQASAS